MCTPISFWVQSFRLPAWVVLLIFKLPALPSTSLILLNPRKLVFNSHSVWHLGDLDYEIIPLGWSRGQPVSTVTLACSKLSAVPALKSVKNKSDQWLQNPSCLRCYWSFSYPWETMRVFINIWKQSLCFRFLWDAGAWGIADLLSMITGQSQAFTIYFFTSGTFLLFLLLLLAIPCSIPVSVSLSLFYPSHFHLTLHVCLCNVIYGQELLLKNSCNFEGFLVCLHRGIML